MKKHKICRFIAKKLNTNLIKIELKKANIKQNEDLFSKRS